MVCDRLTGHVLFRGTSQKQKEPQANDKHTITAMSDEQATLVYTPEIKYPLVWFPESSLGCDGASCDLTTI